MADAGPADDDEITCGARGRGGDGQVASYRLGPDGDLIGQPGLQGGRDPGKQQASELGWPLIVVYPLSRST